MGKALIFDTETTGLREPIEIVEAAWMELTDFPQMANVKSLEQRYKPSKQIELGALATSHILDEELFDCPASSTFELPEGVEYLIGHNVDFDWRVAGEPDVKRICTKALFSYLHPEADSHTQSAAIYYYYRSEAGMWLRNAHSALVDVRNNWYLLQALVGELMQAEPLKSFEDLYQASEKARVPLVMVFGKYKGRKISEVPADYCRWYLRQGEQDPYVAEAFQRRLGNV
jgi:exodeoxyribonuclease X